MIDIITSFWEKHAIVLGIIGFSFTILSTILAIIFYKKSKIVRLLTYYKKTTSFFYKNENIIDIAVSYKGESISSLYITELLFYNQSSDVLKKEDLVNDKFSVSSESRIFAVDVLEAKKESAIQTKCTDNKSIWTVCFDYLNKEDSFLLRVVHEKDDIKISTELKGGKIELHQLTKIKKNLLKLITPTIEIVDGQMTVNIGIN